MPGKTEVIIVAGGLGRRMAASIPKAFLPLVGRPLFLHALQKFAALPVVAGIILVVPSEAEKQAQTICSQSSCREQVRAIVAGGPRRQDSVRNGLDQLQTDTTYVLIHDAARPFVTAELVERVLSQTEQTGAAVPGIPLADTLKRVSGTGLVQSTVERRNLVSVQTPQGFRVEILRKAYQHAWEQKIEATDDATLVEALGYPVAVVEGERTNFKLTTHQDLLMAESLLKCHPKHWISPEMRSKR